MIHLDSDRDQAVAGTEAACPSMASDFALIMQAVINDSGTSNLAIFTLGDGDEQFRITASPGSTSAQIRFRGKESDANRIANVDAGATAFSANEKALISVSHTAGQVTLRVIRGDVGSGTVYSGSVAAATLDMPSDLSLWCLGATSAAGTGVGGNLGCPEGAYGFAIRDHAITDADMQAMWDSGNYMDPIESEAGNMTGIGGCTFAVGMGHFNMSGYPGSVVQSPETCFQGASLDATSTVEVSNGATYADPFTLGWTKQAPGRALSAGIVSAGHVTGSSGNAAGLVAGTYDSQIRVMTSNRSRATRKVPFEAASGTRMQNFWDSIVAEVGNSLVGVDGLTPYVNTNNGKRPLFDCVDDAPWRSDPSVNLVGGNYEGFGTGNPGNLALGMGSVLRIPAGESYEVLVRTDEYGLVNAADLNMSMLFMIAGQATIGYSLRSYDQQAGDGGSTEISAGSVVDVGDASPFTQTGRVSSANNQIVYSGDLTASIQPNDYALVTAGTNVATGDSCNCVLSVDYDGGANETTVVFQKDWHDASSVFSPANDDQIRYTSWEYHKLSLVIPDQTGTNPSHNWRGLRITATGDEIFLCLHGANQTGNGVVAMPYGAGAATEQQLLSAPFTNADGEGHDLLISLLDPDVMFHFLCGGPTASDYRAYTTKLCSAVRSGGGTPILVGDGQYGSLNSLNPNDEDALIEEMWSLVPSIADAAAVTMEAAEVGKFSDRIAAYDMSDGAHPGRGNHRTIEAAFRMIGTLPSAPPGGEGKTTTNPGDVIRQGGITEPPSMVVS